jgi:polysaccharide biosynthesis transport protein
MSLASSSQRPSLRGQFIDADFDFASLGAALWRARYTILRPTILVALITFAVVIMIPPKYQSEARVLIVGRDNVFLRPDADKDVIDRGTIDQDTVTSQAQLIMSREVANEVIAKLKLNELPEFDPGIGGISLIKSLLGFVGIVKNPMNMTPEERVLEAYYDRLTVFPVEKSHVIVIDFLSENPELAARAANAIADAFLTRLQEAKQDQARNASTWLSGEIESLRKKVADSEAKVEAFRAKSNLLVGPNNTQLSVQQLGDLNTQLATARAQKSDAEAKAKLIRDMLKSGEPIESSDIVNSELIRRLSEQRVTLRAQLAEQSSSLLGNHPRIKELKAQIGDLDIQIRKEAEILARSLENDAKLADAKVNAQLVTFNQLKSQAVTSNEDDVQLRAFERDAKSQRDLLESYLAKYREATARDSIASAPADARVISRATVSTVPSYPKKLPTIAIASLATLVLMSGIVLTRELMDSPAAGARSLPLARTRRRKEADPDAGVDTDAAPAERPAEPERAGRPPMDTAGSLAARLRSVVRKEPPQKEPPPVGVPVSAIEEFAYNLHAAGVEGSQIAFFAATPHLDTGWVAVKFARALARDARVLFGGARRRRQGDQGDFLRSRRARSCRADVRCRVVWRHHHPRRGIEPQPHRVRARRQPQRAARRAGPRPQFRRAGARLSACRHRCRPARRARHRTRHGSRRPHRHARDAARRDALRHHDHASARQPARRRLRQCHHRDRRPRRQRHLENHPADPRRRGVALSIRPREAGEGDHTKCGGGGARH